MRQKKFPWFKSYKDNPKHYDILFCGDNWTSGSELSEERYSRGEKLESYVWSNVVSERTGKTNFNLSKPGESNDWIARSVVDWFESGNAADTAVIQFAWRGRQSYWSKKYRGELISINQATIKQELWDKDPFVIYWKNYFEHCHTEYSEYQTYCKNLCLIDSYLKSKGVKPIYLSVEKEPELFSFPLDYFAYYCRNIKVKYLCELIGHSSSNPENYNQHLVHPKYKDPNARGHSIIADYIISQL